MNSPINAQRPRIRSVMLRALPLALAVVVVDEALKMLVRHTMSNCTTHEAIGCDSLNSGGMLGILRVENAGSALGFVQGSWAWLALAALGLLLIPLCRQRAIGRGSAAATGAGLMAGGALGNFLDRLAYGSVTDFIALGDTIVINPADVALLAGMVLMTRALWPSRRERCPDANRTQQAAQAGEHSAWEGERNEEQAHVTRVCCTTDRHPGSDHRAKDKLVARETAWNAYTRNISAKAPSIPDGPLVSGRGI